MNPKNSPIPLESNTALVSYPRVSNTPATSRTRSLCSCKVLA
jgi:hypothetical protein